jgi:hypothetical protein
VLAGLGREVAEPPVDLDPDPALEVRRVIDHLASRGYSDCPSCLTLDTRVELAVTNTCDKCRPFSMRQAELEARVARVAQQNHFIQNRDFKTIPSTRYATFPP